MKKTKIKDAFLDHLRKVPIIQVACEKSGVSRNSVYRWKKEDKIFESEMVDALEEGEALVNDMSESQLLSLIKEKNWPAISFWLRHRNPKFRDKIEVTTKHDNEALTPEQESIIREALRLATSDSGDINNVGIKNYGTDKLQPTDSRESDGTNDKG
ncbi:MAG: hypothetical protein WCT46_02415 [Candidatus Gracilibacteria bacterium]|jgi:hypothetical protein